MIAILFNIKELKESLQQESINCRTIYVQLMVCGHYYCASRQCVVLLGCWFLVGDFGPVSSEIETRAVFLRMTLTANLLF